MNNRRNIFFLLALFCTGSCILFGFEKQRDGILFELKKPGETDARWLKIQVCTENIIRVIAVQDTPFSKRPSLMTDRTQWAPVPWSVKTNAGDIEISTAKVTVRVNSLSGAVAFYSPQDRLLLHEKTGGGKIITAAEAMGEQTFHIRQFFDSPDDEAFYGLGGHQNSIMNYKGHGVDLWQYNIVKSIPFRSQAGIMEFSGTITPAQNSEISGNINRCPDSRSTEKTAVPEDLQRNILKILL